MGRNLVLETAPGNALADVDRREVIALCNRAYQEDLESLFNTFVGATHVIGYHQHSMVSHAMWVTRWLQCGDMSSLRTAYVEMVATDPDFEGRGFATAVMKRLAADIVGFDLGALSPADSGIYARLGWVSWAGPLFIRSSGGLLPTPGEGVMVLHLPGTPPLDLEAPLSAEWREGELW